MTVATLVSRTKEKIQRDSDDIEPFLLLILLIVLIAFSLADAIWRLSDRWTTPALFVALLVILRLLWKLRTEQTQMLEEQIEQLKKVVEDATDHTVGEVRRCVTSNGADIQFYDSSEKFYSALTEAVRSATDQIDTTYVRHYPPDRVKDSGADRYFTEVLEWAKRGEGRYLRRIFCVSPENSPMSEWLAGHRRVAETIDNYQWKLIEWPLTVDAINIAVFDETITFLLVAGQVADRLRGLSIKSSNMAKYFRDYHSALWEIAAGADRVAVRP
jgi:hypothetical protein